MVQIPKRGKDPFLKANHVEQGDLVVVTAPAYLRESKFGERTIVEIKVKRTGNLFRWTLNNTTNDRCVEAWSPDSDLWKGKTLKIQNLKQTVRGEEKSVLYGAPFKEPALA